MGNYLDSLKAKKSEIEVKVRGYKTIKERERAKKELKEVNRLINNVVRSKSYKKSELGKAATALYKAKKAQERERARVEREARRIERKKIAIRKRIAKMDKRIAKKEEGKSLAMKLRKGMKQDRIMRKLEERKARDIKIAKAKAKTKVFNVSENNRLYLGLKKGFGYTDEELAELGLVSDADFIRLYNATHRDPHNELFYAGGDPDDVLRRLALPEDRLSSKSGMNKIIMEALRDGEVDPGAEE